MNLKLTSSSGILDIISDGTVSCLCASGSVIAADWFDQRASKGHYYAIAETSPFSCAKYFSKISDVLNFGIDDQILQLLTNSCKFLSNGEYNISIQRNLIDNFELHYDFVYPETGVHRGVEYYEYEYYAQELDVVFTVKFSQLNRTRVQHYMEMIESGYRPKAVLMAATYKQDFIDSSTALYVLDGHHKLLAYQELGIVPEYILINAIKNAAEEFPVIKRRIFFQVSPILTDFARKHVISVTTQVFDGNDSDSLLYNQYLDQYLYTTKELEPAVHEALREASEMETPESFQWLVSKLNILDVRFKKGESVHLSFPFEGGEEWLLQRCCSTVHFDAWCRKMFNATREEISKGEIMQGMPMS